MKFTFFFNFSFALTFVGPLDDNGHGNNHDCGTYKKGLRHTYYTAHVHNDIQTRIWCRRIQEKISFSPSKQAKPIIKYVGLFPSLTSGKHRM